jgi:HK97 gp10 family phage protein
MFSAKLDGLDSLMARIEKTSEAVRDGVQDELAAAAQNIRLEAAYQAPKNLGKLSQSIQVNLNDRLAPYVYSSAKYAPYIEWGTGGKVSVPAKYASYAMQFKGKGGGTLEEMLLAIMDWVRQKGLAGSYSVKTQRRAGNKSARMIEDAEVAYPIAIAILRKGIRPQPFFFSAVENEKPRLIKRIKNLLK